MKQSESEAREARVAKRFGKVDKNLFLRMLAASATSSIRARKLLKASADLNITEWRVLWDTAEAGPLSVQDIARIQRTDQSLISRALPSMREKGLVKTKQGTEDRRQLLVHITAKGRRAYERAGPVMKARRVTLAKAFSAEELETFLGLITKFEAHLADTKALQVDVKNPAMTA